MSTSSSSSSSSAWIMSPANSTSTTGTWMVVDAPRPATISDLPPPRWSPPTPPSSKCSNCGCPVYTTVQYPEFPGACAWCHRGMVQLFRRYAGPSASGWPDRAEIMWRAELLRFHKAVVEKRRVHGFQDRVSTPHAKAGRRSPVLAGVHNGARIRVDPERVRKLRELSSWRAAGPEVQPVLSQSVEAVEADVRGLTIAKLKPILRAEGLRVSGTKAQMQERFVDLLNTHIKDGAVTELNRLAYLTAQAKFGIDSVAGSMSDAPARQDPQEAIDSPLLDRNGQPSDGITRSGHEAPHKTGTIITSSCRKR
ncbi:hypothetical protein MMC15_008229 [Xylographa vitiligo]|nr:hypothetical protein [Xylographa vitiligo]